MYIYKNKKPHQGKEIFKNEKNNMFFILTPMTHLPNVLIVDNSAENLDLLDAIFRHKKIKSNLIRALSGQMALEKIHEIDLALVEKRTDGLGLLNIQQRIMLIRGEITIKTAPGKWELEKAIRTVISGENYFPERENDALVEINSNTKSI